MKYSREQVRHIHRSDCLNFERFDTTYNVDTASPIIAADDNEEEMRPWWEDNSNILPDSEGYQPVPLYWVDMMIKYFSSNNIQNYSLIDVGSGKGKVVLYSLLKNAPFSDYIAVEADEKYANIFTQNINKTNININKPVKQFIVDAIDFDYSANNRVYFFFQPFSVDFFQKFFNKHLETFKTTNSYLVFVVGEQYNIGNMIGLDPVFAEGLLSIYKFGDSK